MFLRLRILDEPEATQRKERRADGHALPPDTGGASGSGHQGGVGPSRQGGVAQMKRKAEARERRIAEAR